MSVDPDPGKPPEPTHTPSVRERLPIPQAKRRYKHGNEPDAPDGPPATRRPRPDEEDSQGAALADERIADEIEALSARVRALTAQRAATPRPGAEETRGAKYFRLARKQAPPLAPRDLAAPAASPESASTLPGVDSDSRLGRKRPSSSDPRDPASPDAAPEPAPAAPGADSAAAPAPGPAGPITLPTPPAIHYTPWHDTAWHPGWLLASAGILVLGLLSFFLGRASNRPVVIRDIAPALAPVWSAADIGQLDKIIALDRSGDLNGAFQQARRLNTVLGARESLTLYSAVLQARAGGVNNAEADLARNVSAYAPPLTNAAVQDRLGFVYARRRDFNSASACFAAAVSYNPFDPMGFYHWGEALRRSGKLVDAIDKFQAALLRLPPESPETASLRECSALRLRLTRIELGSDTEIKTMLDQQLRQPVPSVYWLLTAVAYDLQHNDPASAVAAAERTKVVASSEEFELLFNDYFLRALAARTPGMAVYAPELTRERRARLDAGHAYFIDP